MSVEPCRLFLDTNVYIIAAGDPDSSEPVKTPENNPPADTG
jgi:hypothetical protein